MGFSPAGGAAFCLSVTRRQEGSVLPRARSREEWRRDISDQCRVTHSILGIKNCLVFAIFMCNFMFFGSQCGNLKYTTEIAFFLCEVISHFVSVLWVVVFFSVCGIFPRVDLHLFLLKKYACVNVFCYCLNCYMKNTTTKITKIASKNA